MKTKLKLTKYQIDTLSTLGPFWAWLRSSGQVEEMIVQSSDSGDTTRVLVGGQWDSAIQWQRVQICIAAEGCTWCSEQSAPDLPSDLRQLFWPDANRAIAIAGSVTFSTAGGVATFVDSRAVGRERLVRHCRLESPDDESDLAAWIDANPEPGMIWESRTKYLNGSAAGLPVFRVKAVTNWKAALAQSS